MNFEPVHDMLYLCYFVLGKTVFGQRVMMSLTVWSKKDACQRSIARRMSPSVMSPATLPYPPTKQQAQASLLLT